MLKTHHGQPSMKTGERPDPSDFSYREEQSEFPEDAASESDCEVIINIPTQSPETSDIEATLHTPPKNTPPGLKVQLGVLPNFSKEGNPPL